MIEKIFQKLLKKAYPDRDFDVTKIGKRFCTTYLDHLGNITYSLQGTHSYEEVAKLNDLIINSIRCGYCPEKELIAIYGYCPEKGPIAIIGIPNPPNANTDWRFFREVTAYGELPTFEELEFHKYSEEDAKHISKLNLLLKKSLL